jgi:hypothetical protein
MAWHVRYFNPSLKTDLQSLEFPTEAHALQAAWHIAREDGRIKLVEGPDGESAGLDEIELWFREHGLVLPQSCAR